MQGIWKVDSINFEILHWTTGVKTLNTLKNNKLQTQKYNKIGKHFGIAYFYNRHRHAVIHAFFYDHSLNLSSANCQGKACKTVMFLPDWD